MARADQIKALFRAYAGNEDAQFISVALQVAADEARRGHSKLAAELRELIEKARAPAAPRARARTLPLVQPRGELAELLTAQYPQHPLKHMVLSREVEQKLQRVLLEQRQHERLSEHGLTARRKLLLVGPPGHLRASLAPQQFSAKSGRHWQTSERQLQAVIVLYRPVEFTRPQGQGALGGTPEH